MAQKQKNLILELSPEEQKVLQMAIEFYIRMGLGQFSENAQRLDLLYGERIGSEKMDEVRRLCNEIEEKLWDENEQWKLQDPETSIYMLFAYLLDAKLNDRPDSVRYATRRIEEIKKQNKEKIQ